MQIHGKAADLATLQAMLCINCVFIYLFTVFHLCVRMNEDHLHYVISLAADVHFRLTCITATRTNDVSYMCTFADWLCKSAMESNQLLFIFVRFDSDPAHTCVSLETLLES